MTAFLDEIEALFPQSKIETIGTRCFLVKSKGASDLEQNEVRVKLAVSPIEIQCLQREALWLHRLRHSPLCVQHSCSLERHGPLMILTTNHVQGISVDHLLRSADITPEQRKNVIEQLLTLLDGLSEEGIVHGDIKLSNLILSKKSVLSLVDFANTRRVGEPLSERGILQVTPCYQYPKAMTEAHPYLDVYAALLCICVLGNKNADSLEEGLSALSYLSAFFLQSDALKWLALGLETEHRVSHLYSSIADDLKRMGHIQNEKDSTMSFTNEVLDSSSVLGRVG
ncbi:protein kinase domain-containing protein [Marinomonas balearica]|uniref:Protein kinase-like protein n=1 Tax=Marinomonas balearica TaxID=491947 RepID=A0A4R6M9D6_9GAMM|nr:protein kinase [Marinomonas balearica]TDO98043.1 protein kinase-like protein [Marinomonas balearica]